jgi:hypothetical protein
MGVYKRILLVALVMILLAEGVALCRDNSTPVPIRKVEGKVVLDGKLDEPLWANAVKMELAYEWMPGDNTPAPLKTVCAIAYSRHKLFIAFLCYDAEPAGIRAHLMDRDAYHVFQRDDYVSVTIDPFNDRRRAFRFMANPLGVQVDAAYNGLEEAEDFSWDAIWDAAASVGEQGYVVEMAIPFSQLRFSKNKNPQVWGFSFQRSVPRQERLWLGSHRRDRNTSCQLCQAHKIEGFAGIAPGKDLEFQPTVTMDRTETKEGVTVDPGISLRWGILPNVSLNAAVNPDFSQVEADVAELDVNRRFAIYYPEKRPFFLEGADMFATPMDAVFSRTVADPRWGMKLTGKEGRHAFGIFSAQDTWNNVMFPSNQGSRRASFAEEVAGGVARYRVDVGDGSTLGVLYTGRFAGDYTNQVAGVDGFFRLSKSDSLTVQGLLSRTGYPDDVADQYHQPRGNFNGGGLFLKFYHNARNLIYGVEYESLGAGFRADYGFVPRVDFRRSEVYVEPVIWGKKGGWFQRLAFMARGEYITDQQGNLTDRDIRFRLSYQGPWQLTLRPMVLFQREFYDGVYYDRTAFVGSFDITPVNGLTFYSFVGLGDYVDYVNSRPGYKTTLNGGLVIATGKRLSLSIDNAFERQTSAGSRLYTANLLQTRLVFNFNVRTFVRVMLQFTAIRRNAPNYLFPVEAEEEKLFTQVLFSYKLNPRTVFFAGYSDNRFGGGDLDLLRKDSTFFLKIGYAFGL